MVELKDRPVDYVYQNFQEVTAGLPGISWKLYRSSAPNYYVLDHNSDLTQNLSNAAIDFLCKHDIKAIINFNVYNYNTWGQNKLRENGIAYLHLPVKDFTAPTIDQLQQAVNFCQDNETNTQIHCGYGYSRTGVGVTAIQLHATKGSSPAENQWGKVNHVEDREQLAVLKRWRDDVCMKL